jgi:hypothetical protein
MDQIIFNRLRSYVFRSLGPDFQKWELSKLVVTIMTFVETKVEPRLEGSEKLSLVMSWLTKLLAESQGIGSSLPPETITLISGFISRICEACKGNFEINTPKPPPLKSFTVTTKK